MRNLFFFLNFACNATELVTRHRLRDHSGQRPWLTFPGSSAASVPSVGSISHISILSPCTPRPQTQTVPGQQWPCRACLSLPRSRRLPCTDERTVLPLRRGAMHVNGRCMVYRQGWLAPESVQKVKGGTRGTPLASLAANCWPGWRGASSCVLARVGPAVETPARRASAFPPSVPISQSARGHAEPSRAPAPPRDVWLGLRSLKFNICIFIFL